MNSVELQGSLGLLPPAWHHLYPEKDRASGELYQTSLMSALLGGVYEGQMTYAELETHGDFGLGTFNDLDGEMIAFDGGFFQLRSDGSACPVSPLAKTPFAVVTTFRPDLELTISATITKPSLLAIVDAATDANLFAAVRIQGLFKTIKTRTVSRQTAPFQPLTEVTKGQTENTFENIRGTLAGFRSPAYAQGIGVAGFHLHFLRDDKQAGGHCLDFSLLEGSVHLATLHSLHIELPDSAAFLNANLSSEDFDAEVRSTEG